MRILSEDFSNIKSPKLFQVFEVLNAGDSLGDSFDRLRRSRGHPLLRGPNCSCVAVTRMRKDHYTQELLCESLSKQIRLSLTYSAASNVRMRDRGTTDLCRKTTLEVSPEKLLYKLPTESPSTLRRPH